VKMKCEVGDDVEFAVSRPVFAFFLRYMSVRRISYGGAALVGVGMSLNANLHRICPLTIQNTLDSASRESGEISLDLNRLR